MIPVEIPGTQITIHEVLGSSPRDLADLLAIHAELFPQYAYYQGYMRYRAAQPPTADPRFVDHWWLIRVNGAAAAIRFFKFVPARNCGIALAIGIRPEFRLCTFGKYRRFSEAILSTSLNQLRADAEERQNPVPVGMVTETEDYLHPRYYGEYGHIRLPVDYLEPSFTAEAQAFLENGTALTFRSIELGILPADQSQFNLYDLKMLNDIVSALLVDHYGLPDDHWAVRRARDSITLALKAEDK